LNQITISGLQKYIKKKHHQPELKHEYFDIEVEKWIYAKEKLNDIKYGRNLADSLSCAE